MTGMFIRIRCRGLVLGVRGVLRGRMRDVLGVGMHDVLRIRVLDVLRIRVLDVLRIGVRDMLRVGLFDVLRLVVSGVPRSRMSSGLSRVVNGVLRVRTFRMLRVMRLRRRCDVHGVVDGRILHTALVHGVRVGSYAVRCVIDGRIARGVDRMRRIRPRRAGITLRQILFARTGAGGDAEREHDHERSIRNHAAPRVQVMVRLSSYIHSAHCSPVWSLPLPKIPPGGISGKARRSPDRRIPWDTSIPDTQRTITITAR